MSAANNSNKQDIIEIIIDTETTGLDPADGHRVIEIGCVELINRTEFGREYHVYLNPKRDIPEDSFAVHGISEEFLKDKPTFSQIVNEFLDFIKGYSLVAHNASFDCRFINHELNSIALPELKPARWVDTLPLARKKHPGQPASLDAICERYGISLDSRTKHGALIDARLLGEAYKFLRRDSSDKSLNFTDNIGMESYSLNFEKRSFINSKEELKRHEQLLKGIKNPLWSKYN